MYEAGELAVVAYKDGVENGQRTRCKRHGAAAQLKLTPDRATIASDGRTSRS